VAVLSREFILNQTDYELDLRFMVEGEEVVVYAYHDSGRHSAERIEAILADLAMALDRVAADPRRACPPSSTRRRPWTIPIPSGCRTAGCSTTSWPAPGRPRTAWPWLVPTRR
jgi:hypothetical protein